MTTNSNHPAIPAGEQDERAAFEAWAKRKKMPLARIGEQYDDFWVDHAWNGWQARARMAAPAAPQSDAKEIAGVTLDGCLETLFRLGEYLGVDYAEARKQPGAPSSVYIKAIEDRLLAAAPAAGDALDAARYRWLKSQPEVTPDNFTTDRRLSIVVEDWSHNLGSTNLINCWGSASLHGAEADAAIDAAIAAQQGEGGAA